MLLESRVPNMPGLTTSSFHEREVTALPGPASLPIPAPHRHAAHTLLAPPATRARTTRVPRSQCENCCISHDPLKSRSPRSRPATDSIPRARGPGPTRYSSPLLRCTHWHTAGKPRPWSRPWSCQDASHHPCPGSAQTLARPPGSGTADPASSPLGSHEQKHTGPDVQLGTRVHHRSA